MMGLFWYYNNVKNMACCSDDLSPEEVKERRPTLKFYYSKLMPLAVLYKLFSYGKPETFAKREISFSFDSGAYVRYQSFDKYQDMVDRITKKIPLKIDIGAIYKSKPKIKYLGLEITPTMKELVFDIDISDYDDVRTCCSGAGICSKCWKLMAIGSKIITVALNDDFNCYHLLWVFSGRRGIHGWVADKHARQFTTEERSALTDYLMLLKKGNKAKKVNLAGRVHPKIFRRALKIIDKYFMTILEEQDLLGTDERLKMFLLLIDKDIRKPFQNSMTNVKCSVDRWEAFEKTFLELQETKELPKNLKYLREEIKLQYTYPRLDVHVTKNLDHLLKIPFCIHPKTLKVCIPFDVELVDDFDPKKVPTLSTILEEINYNKNFEELSEFLKAEDIVAPMIVDYEKTSLKEPVDLLIKFIDNLETDEGRNM